MKSKIKKWHIVLMSFLALFVTIFASLFSLRADTIDEETGEIITDNWELGIVFYDSTVDGGTTPLTEINWDASTGNYSAGSTRVITVQINYKNNSAVTTYAPGELEITIPNLIYGTKDSSSALWTSSVAVGANDQTHTGYDWNFSTGSAPTINQKTFNFTNAITIEEKTNFEGSIQIVYTITPDSETPERYEEQCIHNLSKSLQATLGKTGERAGFEKVLSNTEHKITSPNWPNEYNNNLSASTTYWEYTSNTLENLILFFDETSSLENGYDKIFVYDKTGTCVYTLTGTEMAGKLYNITGNYVKIAMSSDSSQVKKGFSVKIGNGDIETAYIIPEGMSLSNTIQFDYTRTYSHPWQYSQLEVQKKAATLDSNLQDRAWDYCSSPTDYYWVEYRFIVKGDFNYLCEYYYPYIPVKYYKFEDVLPENCIIFPKYASDTVTVENNKYTIIVPQSNIHVVETLGYNTSHKYGTSIIVGYPKEEYEQQSNSLITNIVDLSATYADNPDSYIYQHQDDVSLYLSGFSFSYRGDLYGIDKNFFVNSSYEEISGLDPMLSKNNEVNLNLTAIYTGKPMDVKFGDDLLYITSSDGSYRKLDPDEYYFANVKFDDSFYNGYSESKISLSNYDIELWVKSQENPEYSLYTTFKGKKTISFTEEQHITGYYFIIKNLNRSIRTSPPGTGGYSPQVANIRFKNADNIAEEGKIYNFAYIEIYIDGQLVNAPNLNSYASFITQEEIATHDIETYGHYVQRDFASDNYTYYEIIDSDYDFFINKTFSSPIQDATNEIFTGTCNVSFGNDGYLNGLEWTIHEMKNYITDEDRIIGFEFFDLLPYGMELTSSKQEILNTFKYLTEKPNMLVIYDKEGNKVNVNDFKQLLIDGTTLEIINDYNNTGRDLIHILIKFEDEPLVIKCSTHSYSSSSDTKILDFSYNYKIPYDAYLEYGHNWSNTIYWNYYNRTGNGSKFFSNSSYYYLSKDSNGNIIDNFDLALLDLDNDGEIDWTYTAGATYYYSNKFSSDTATTTINSIVSTHQDVTTYVKTDQSYYSTGTVDASCDSEYEYKLRVRTGAADVTNLIIYSNLEEAQPERQRWKGEFLGFDTSYAENKGYNIKTYYSENTAAGNLYNEDGTLNSDWKEYTFENPTIYAQGLEVKFNSQCRTESANWDYVEIYYILNGITYKLGKWGGTDLAGKTIQIPTNDFYLYWHTDSSASSYYGFSIDSITYNPIKNTNTTTGTLPSYTTEEIYDNVYPDSAFDSYTHGNYGNNINKIWHYTYTGEKEIIQEATSATDPTLVKSLAFEYLNSEGNPAVLPSNSLTYVLIQMKSPSDENITTLARMDCRTQWNAIDDFDRPVDFITGINSNVVKVALPNSVDEDSNPSISLRFTKEINGTSPEFENMKLDIVEQQTFMIRLTDLIANEDGSYNQITALLKSDQELIISQIPVGTYLLEELSDNYFDFVDFTNNNDPEIIIEGVTFERTDQGYIITVSENLTENIEFNIKVTNEIEPNRFYEDKNSQENLFLKNKIEENE